MRRKVLGLLLRTMLVFILFLLPIHFILRMFLSYQEFKIYSQTMFCQLDQLQRHSEQDIQQVTENLSEGCLRIARVVDYITFYNPEVAEDLEKTRELAEALKVSEIHFMDDQGVIVAGTHPEYNRHTLYSREGMQDFLPMLKDRSLELCQDIHLQTAKDTTVQYAAVWRRDGSGILQIGISLDRLADALQTKTLAASFELVPKMPYGTLLVADAKTGVVLASTTEAYMNRSVSRFLDLSRIQGDDLWIQTISFDHMLHCVVLQAHGDLIYINTYPFTAILPSIFIDTILILVYLILLSLITMALLARYMDQKLVRGLEHIAARLKCIEKGQLDEIHVDTKIPELDTLQHYINKLLHGILGSFQKFSSLIERSNIPMGIYEYNTFYHRVFTNQNVFDILHLESSSGGGSLQTNFAHVTQRIQELREQPYSSDDHIYQLVQDGRAYYIHMEELDYEQSHLVWMLDVTQLWGKMEVLKTQRDIDVLTKLFNRRAFFETMVHLFAQREELGHAAIVVIDADNLKTINDVYGHHHGDRYLEEISKLLLAIDNTHALCSRMGGDEFTVFLYGYPSIDALRHVILSLKNKRETVHMQINDATEVPISFSIGYAIYPDEDLDYHNLIDYADERMYLDKKTRKKRRADPTPPR